MSKISTPAIEKQKQAEAKRKRPRVSTPAREAWRRLVRNKAAVFGLVVIAIFVLLAVFAGVLTKYEYADQDYSVILQPPSAEHLMGTDNFGRDIFTRILYGARVSLPIGILCVISSLVVGGFLGVVSGYCGGIVESVIMRLSDVFQSIPPMLLAIAILAALGNGVVNLIIANTIATLPLFIRISRAAIYTVKENEFIEASRAIGAKSFRLMFVHMLPNALGPIIVTATFGVAASILCVSALSYLGLGIAPPTAEWGAMLSDAKDYITKAPYFIIFPGVMIMISVFSINLFGDGLRDALDPRMK